MRSHTEIFAELAAPFPDNEVRERPKGGRQLRYITARTARRRLNEVIGPFRWNCTLKPADRWVLCSITVTLDDGTVVQREALGGYPSMPDEEDSVKGGDSDAFKRCCVLFGVAEYLYDETDHHAEGARPYQRPTDIPRERQDQSGSLPRTGAGLYAWVCRLEEQHGYAPKGLVRMVDQAFGPQSEHRYPRQWKDWSESQIKTAVTYVEHVVARQEAQKPENTPY